MDSSNFSSSIYNAYYHADQLINGSSNETKDYTFGKSYSTLTDFYSSMAIDNQQYDNIHSLSKSNSRYTQEDYDYYNYYLNYYYEQYYKQYYNSCTSDNSFSNSLSSNSFSLSSDSQALSLSSSLTFSEYLKSTDNNNINNNDNFEFIPSIDNFEKIGNLKTKSKRFNKSIISKEKAYYKAQNVYFRILDKMEKKNIEITFESKQEAMKESNKVYNSLIKKYNKIQKCHEKKVLLY